MAQQKPLTGLEELRILYLYEYKKGSSGARAARNINEAFGAGTIGEKAVRRWYEKFRNNDFSFENGPVIKQTNGSNENDSLNGSKNEDLNQSISPNVPFKKLKYLDKLYLYEYKLGNSPTKAFRNISGAFGPDSVTVRTMEYWFDKFKKTQGDYKTKGSLNTSLNKSTQSPNTSQTKKKLSISNNSKTPMKPANAARIPELQPLKVKPSAAMPPEKPLAKIQIRFNFFGKRKKNKDRKRLKQP